MRFKKWIVILCFQIGLIGCMPLSEEKSDATENTQLEAAQPVPDYNKAGLINVQLGLGYLKQGDITRAKSKLVHALELAPKLPDPYSAMGYFYETVSEKERAEKFYRKAIRLGAGSGKYHNNYAAFLCREKRFKQAEREFLKAIEDESYTRTAAVYESAGICALEAGESEKANTYFETALLRDPRSTRSILELAALKHEAQNHQAAKMLLANFAKYSKATARSLYLEMQVAKALGDQDQQASKLLLLKELYPQSQEYQQWQAKQESKSHAS